MAADDSTNVLFTVCMRMMTMMSMSFCRSCPSCWPPQAQTCRGTDLRTVSPTSNPVDTPAGHVDKADFPCKDFFFSKKKGKNMGKINTNKGYHYFLCLDNNNRVKLLSEPGMPGSDYINASFISVSAGYHSLTSITYSLDMRLRNSENKIPCDS